MTDLRNRKMSCLTPGPAPAKRDIFLCADAHERTELTAAAVAAEVEDRIVSGLVLPYGPVGYTSVGPVRVPQPGRIAIPTDLSRVKLMDYHQSPPVSLGPCIAVRETTEGLRASFRVANTPAGDAALVELREGARDGLSVELGAIDLRDDELLASQLLGVALVPIPAWDDARHDGLAAAREDSTTTAPTTESETSMTPEQRARLTELIAMNARTPEEEAEFQTLIRDLATSPDEAAQAAAEDAAPELAASHVVPTGPAVVPATTPGGGPAGRTAAGRPQRDIRELFASMARVLSGHSRPQLEAALADITLSANIWTTEDEYGGQLWSGLEYQRRFVPLLTPGPLNSNRGTGWRWVTKPEVGDYAGDKAPVPSNLAETEATEWIAARLAGAHDIDRAHVDFGNSEFIAAYYAAMTESYAVKSDAKALARILAMGTANAAVVGATTIVGAATRAANAVMEATGGATPDYFLVNSGNLITSAEDGSLSAMGDNSALQAFGVTPDKFLVAPGVAAGTVVAGVRQAARWRELGSTPIRVEALNIANGGVDGGVFGYYATEAVHDEGVQRATFA